jgi:biotin synthase
LDKAARLIFLSNKSLYSRSCLEAVDFHLISKAIYIRIHPRFDKEGAVEDSFYSGLVSAGLNKEPLSEAQCLQILESPNIRLLALLDAAYQLRHVFYGKKVFIHIIDNVQNGACPEDCRYCAQSRNSSAPIKTYGFKSDEEILAEARQAYSSGAFRHCLVFSGRTPSLQRIEHLAGLVREMKSLYPMEICVSPGILDREKAEILKAAGVDRVNHNLNTSRRFYPQICSTHSYDDRLATLRTAQSLGLQICSGMIVGMGETNRDIIQVAQTLASLGAHSIPINFFLPVEGTRLNPPEHLTPEYCLRILALFRILNPAADIRVAAGRELYLKNLEPLALYPANSLFLSGYLNVQGAAKNTTLQMIQAAGFDIQSDRKLVDLLGQDPPPDEKDSVPGIVLKGLTELRPADH